ncbi:hypothetical protein ACFC0S_16050 [Streptomyces sp. NPDC056084]|uniref:hypothetical protein n=1 Tax=unclassified Streptomyces TaxID=2593676 RepID=UPI0035D71146
MTAYPIGVEVACDGPAADRDCPQSAAIRAQITSTTAREVRADGRRDGWRRRRRGKGLVDLCPSCDNATQKEH